MKDTFVSCLHEGPLHQSADHQFIVQFVDGFEIVSGTEICLNYVFENLRTLIWVVDPITRLTCNYPLCIVNPRDLCFQLVRIAPESLRFGECNHSEIRV